MKVTIRNTQVRDNQGRMVGTMFLGNGSVEDAVDSYLTENLDVIADGAAQGVTDWLEENITQPTNPVIDASLSVSGAAADAKATGDEIYDLKSAIEQIEGGGGLTSAIKSALLQLAQKVAYIDDDGQQYYNDLHDALYPTIVYTAITLNESSLSFGSLNTTQTLVATTTPNGGNVVWSSSDTSVATVSQTGVVTSIGYGNTTITATCGSISATCSVAVAQATLVSISADYRQSEAVYDTTSLDDLKADLVVTATWSNESTSVIASDAYTLSGTLTIGTSVITVSYGGETTTFNVTVSKNTDGITAVQGNSYAPNTDSNRCTVTVSNKRVAPQGTLTVSCESGWSVYYQAYYDLSAQTDDGRNVQYSEIQSMITTDSYHKWTNQGTLTINNSWSSTGLTLFDVKFVIKKDDESNITPADAVNAVVITGHTPLESV